MLLFSYKLNIFSSFNIVILVYQRPQILAFWFCFELKFPDSILRDIYDSHFNFNQSVYIYFLFDEKISGCFTHAITRVY